MFNMSEWMNTCEWTYIIAVWTTIELKVAVAVLTLGRKSVLFLRTAKNRHSQFHSKHCYSLLSKFQWYNTTTIRTPYFGNPADTSLISDSCVSRYTVQLAASIFVLPSIAMLNLHKSNEIPCQCFDYIGHFHPPTPILYFVMAKSGNNFQNNGHAWTPLTIGKLCSLMNSENNTLVSLA